MLSLTRLTLQAYKSARLEGEDEVGGILLGVSSRLLEFDFRETFVNAFEVKPS